jgi:hypothetical protein
MFNRFLMRYLRRRGWVVFWLDPQFRICEDENCFLSLYERERLAGR